MVQFLSRVSILLLTRDIAIVILSVRPSVRLSVCPSVRDTLVLYENGLTYRHSFFHHTVAQLFQFYEHQTPSRNSDGITPCGGAKYRWGIKLRDFPPISRYISQTIQDIAMVAMENE